MKMLKKKARKRDRENEAEVEDLKEGAVPTLRGSVESSLAIALYNVDVSLLMNMLVQVGFRTFSFS